MTPKLHYAFWKYKIIVMVWREKVELVRIFIWRFVATLYISWGERVVSTSFTLSLVMGFWETHSRDFELGSLQIRLQENWEQIRAWEKERKKKKATVYPEAVDNR